MLLHPVYRILATLLPLVARCSAEGSDDDASLDLSKSIPECAQTCVENFIKTQYSSQDCASLSDTDCICRTTASDGLTLGEAALGCVYALCSAKVVKSSNVYHICDSVAGAQAGTHATITATTFAAPRSTSSAAVSTTSSTASSYSPENVVASSTSSSITTASSIAPEITSSPGVPNAASTSTGQSTDHSTASPTTSSTTPSPTPNEEEQKQAVSPAAVIGVSVSSGLAGCFIIVVAVVFCCRRWRNKNQVRADSPETGHHFEIGGTMAEPPGFSRASFQR